MESSLLLGDKEGVRWANFLEAEQDAGKCEVAEQSKLLGINSFFLAHWSMATRLASLDDRVQPALD